MKPYDIVDKYHGIKPSTTTERVGKATEAIIFRRKMTTAEVAEETGMSLSGAFRLMSRLCRVLPIGFDYDDNVWIWAGRNGTN